AIFIFLFAYSKICLMDKIKLDIIGISYSQSQSGAYALILGESKGSRRLPIIIGGFEAQAIAIELEKMKPSRPLTHDLFKSFALSFNITVKEVIIDKFIEGVFYAKLICSDGQAEREIDSRTSDAVAIAIRFSCPIYTNEGILSAAGIIMDEEKEAKAKQTNKEKLEDIDESDNEMAEYSASELDEMLMQAIDKEEYEKASKIRDEINKRRKRK
ncbi:bifunctional nuclease domain-containing protein, partial [candidate division KSB1 bacterium]